MTRPHSYRQWSWIEPRNGWLAVFLGLCLASNINSGAFADRITLKGGVKLKGEVIPDPQDPKKVLIYSEQGKNPLRQEKARIVEVIEEQTILDQYLPRLKAVPGTAEGEFDLGFWCEQAKLNDLARHHYEEAIKHDPSFALAHEKLGHSRRGDRWLTLDDIRKAQGLEKVKGRWVTKTQKEQIEKGQALSKEQTDWVRRLRILADRIENGAEDERREAESKVVATHDPKAVTPLVKVFNTDNPVFRKLLARALGMIDGPEAAVALVNGLVNEDDADLRHTFLDELGRRKDPEIEKQLVKALKSNNYDYINRAAWGIANLNLTATSHSLVAALTSTRVDTVMTLPENPMGGVGGGGPMPAPAPALSPAPIAFNGSSVGYLYPPKVGAGVVAYGGGSAPFFNLPSSVSDPLSLAYGSGDALFNNSPTIGATPNRGPTPQVVATEFENPEVLAALVKFTGRDFGYNKDAWRSFLKTAVKEKTPPARRVARP